MGHFLYDYEGPPNFSDNELWKYSFHIQVAMAIHSIQPPIITICILVNSKKVVQFKKKNFHKLLTCCYMQEIQLKLNFHPILSEQEHQDSDNKYCY